MQALMARSEENDGVECLGTIPGEVRYFGEQHRDANGERLKVPTWAGMKSVPASLIPSGKIFRRVRVLFCAQLPRGAERPSVVAGTFEYGVTGCAALSRDNLFATQFHPEKSHTAGLTLLKNFLNWDGQC